ncbi:deacetylvindoline O-acetyltransferase-like [Silene latifolia]|uniref:deacetylvindoline O-acetyltransferase-like n=1 Tax=Silene latifolia TaxID=37657 RepID=UPI003D76B3DF
MVTVDLADNDSEESTEFWQLVAEIQASISKVKDIIGDYNGDRRGETKIDNLYELIKTLVKYKADFYFLLGWSKSAGFADVDFGFGKPNWIIPTHERLYQFRKNTILLVDYLDSEDDIEFEAWLFLEEKKMTMLESNQEFLNFCSPRF